MKISVDKRVYQPVTILLENEKELECMRILSTCGMGETLREAAEKSTHQLVDSEVLDSFLGDLYHRLPS